MDPSLPTALASVAACLVASAFFSGSETALTSLGGTRTRQIIEGDPRAGRALALWADRPLEVLVTILIWNNLVNITASALASQIAESVLGGADAHAIVSPLAVAIGVMTLLLLTFGEITPKTLAKANAERIAPGLMRALIPFYWISFIFMRGFIKLAERMSSITGTDLYEDRTGLVSEADIEYLVRLGRREGSLTGERERLLRSVFEFTDTAVREVMVARTDVVFLSADDSLPDVLDAVIGAGHSRLPVYEGGVDHVIGLCYARDMLGLIHADPDNHRDFDLRDHIREAQFVPETKAISQLLEQMRDQRIHMAIVVDEFGGVAGIVTLEDIIEEFFGDIQDEFDTEEEWIETTPDGDWLLDARYNINEFAEQFGVDPVDSEEFDTVGGLIAKITGEVAHRGTVCDALGFRFTVVEADHARIKRVRAERLPPETDEEETVDAEAATAV